MNFLAHTMHNPNAVIETPTGEKRGDAQLYRWECKPIDFKFEAWVSFSGDYTQAKSEMNLRLREHLEAEGK